jgi:hypothetical protein
MPWVSSIGVFVVISSHDPLFAGSVRQSRLAIVLAFLETDVVLDLIKELNQRLDVAVDGHGTTGRSIASPYPQWQCDQNDSVVLQTF